MTGMAQNSTLWTGLVMLAGALGAMAARKVKVPAACGALAGGLIVAGVAETIGLVRPDTAFARALMAAFVCFVVGAQIDLTPLVRNGRRVIGEAVLQVAAVTLAVGLVAAGCGFAWYTALMVGVAFSATSPTAMIAVASEAGARGPFAQRILVMSSLTLLTASLLVYGFVAPRIHLAGDLAEIIMVGLVGLVALVPLSRIETRGAMTACVAFGVTLFALLTPGYTRASLAIMACLCGFLAGNLLPNREILRDTLRTLALPAAVLLFAGSATFSDQRALWSGAGTGLLLVAGRLAGLYAAATLTFDRVAGLRHAAAQIPIAGLSCAGPVMLIVLWVAPAGPPAQWPLFAALLLSELAGMIATGWALKRSGEARLLAGDPDNWRAAMN